MIRTLIVMATYGQIFYSKESFFGSVQGETDISLTAGLISAIYNMTTEVQQQKITELELEDVRSVFRELPGEKLFIITVDKRMDTDDADDMLDDLSERFVDQYGDMVMDGMILNDFEPTVDEVVEERLWYNTVPEKLERRDLIPLLAILFCAFWYPFWLIDGEKWIIRPLQRAIARGTTDVLITATIRGILTIGPLLVTLILLKYIPNLKLPFKFAGEYLRRPTRGGYAEDLPNWFLVLPLFASIMLYTIIRIGRGIQYSLTIQPFLRDLDKDLKFANGEPAFWFYLTIYFIFYLITWFIIFPALVGLVTEQLNKDWMKSSMINIGISFIPFAVAHLIAGIFYLEWLGFNPGNNALFSQEAKSLTFLFVVTLPANLFLFLYIFLLGVGLAQVVKKNRERYPIGYGISLFITFAIQNVVFFLIFNAGIFFNPLFV